MPRSNLARSPSLSLCVEELDCTVAPLSMLAVDDSLDVPSGDSPALALQRQLEQAVIENFGNRVPVKARNPYTPFIQAGVAAAGCWGVIFGIGYLVLR
jgi:hypothetical protein